jgi:preprotein translocase subunit SecB
MTHPAKLIFEDYEIASVNFVKPRNISEGDFSVELKRKNEIDEPNESGESRITAELRVCLTSTETDFQLIVEVIGNFKVTGPVEEKVLDNYLNVSIPSILYPYIRAFITTLVVQTGMDPIILPPINFGYRPKEEITNE